MNHQTPKMAFSTELAYRCGLRAHELLTIERTSDKRADKRFYADGREKNLSSKFDGMGDGVRYVVTGKGGLTREIFVPKDLAIQLEQRRGCCKIHWISEGFASPSSFREFNGESFLTH